MPTRRIVPADKGHDFMEKSWGYAFIGIFTLMAFMSRDTFAAGNIPKYDHVVIVVEENEAQVNIIGNPSAPYINSLANQGANFTNSYAISHPSEPNYLAFFSGSTQGITDDSCPHTFSGANLGSELIAAGLSFGVVTPRLCRASVSPIALMALRDMRGNIIHG
jgi:hypothetical protein